ncbi:hypothetical protein PAPHI01_1369 [Pancytospora philotis]|nr:hypothetical protein PAPHI01_1369 [Pancytospora philotis]
MHTMYPSTVQPLILFPAEPMITVAVNFLQLSGILGAVDPAQVAASSSGNVVASSDAVQDNAALLGASGAALDQFKRAPRVFDSVAVLKPMRRSFSELLNAYEKWYGGIKQKASAALGAAIEEASKLRHDEDNDESIKRIGSAFHEQFLEIVRSEETRELLTAFAAGCIGVLRAFNDDCDNVLPQCGRNEWSMHFDQGAWALYDELDSSCYGSEWYQTFRKATDGCFRMLQQEIVDFCRHIEPQGLAEQKAAFDGIHAVKDRLVIWSRIYLAFESSFWQVHSLFGVPRTLNPQNGTLFSSTVKRILSQYVSAKAANPGNQSRLWTDVEHLLYMHFSDRKDDLLRAQHEVIDLTWKWSNYEINDAEEDRAGSSTQRAAFWDPDTETVKRIRAGSGKKRVTFLDQDTKIVAD